MRNLYLAVLLLLSPITPSLAEVNVSIGINLPGASIGINVPTYPRLVQVPGYPVYYGPQLNSNYFFYDGLYWVLDGDDWYVSSWYNGPWNFVERDQVPLFVLRVPVRYYSRPPVYFRGWQRDAPPRWGDRWGRDWEQRRSDWNQWDRHSSPQPAPLPKYQRRFKDDGYPRVPEVQQIIRSKKYSYEPREPVSQRHYESKQPRRGENRTDELRQERGRDRR